MPTIPGTTLLAILILFVGKTAQFDIYFNGFKSCKTLTTCDCLQPTDTALPIEIHCPDFADDQMQLYYRLNATLLVQCLPPLNWNTYNNDHLVIEALRQNGNISHVKKVQLSTVEDVKVSHCNLTVSNQDLEWLLHATKPRYLSLRSNILSDNFLLRIKSDKLESIEAIYLENNNLLEIPYKLFNSMQNLRYISLNFNKIVRINQTFNENILSLQLPQNRIESINIVAFKGLKHLKTLHLWSNNISSIDSSYFRDLKNLQELELSRNFLKTLPKDVFLYLHQLKTINLESNLLEALPTRLFNHNKKLESVRIARNKHLTLLPDSLLSNLLHLKNVQLNSCSFKNLDTNLFKSSTNIEIIYLNENLLEMVDEDLFKGLRKLMILNLADNKLTQLPKNLFNDLVNLKDLDVTGNAFTVGAINVFLYITKTVPSFSGNSSQILLA